MFSHKILFALPLSKELQEINLERKKIRGDDCFLETVMAVLTWHCREKHVLPLPVVLYVFTFFLQLRVLPYVRTLS